MGIAILAQEQTRPPMADHRKRAQQQIRELEVGRGPLITALILVVVIGGALIAPRVL